VTDGHDEDHETQEPSGARPTPPREGVRIIGAEEAQAALDSGLAGRRIAESEPKFGDVPARPDTATRPDLTFPRSEAADEPTAEHPDFAEAVAGALAEETDHPIEPIEEPAAPVGLPHWTEPATGEVPIVFADDDEPASGEVPAAPRFRSGGADWDEDELETFRVLGEPEADDVPMRAQELPPEDDDLAFDREVAARRVRTAPAAGTPRSRPRPRPRPAREGDELDLGPERPDMLVRVVTGLGMAAVALLCLNAGSAATTVLATAIVAVCTFELYSALHTRGFRPAAVIGLLGAVTIVPLAYNRAEFAFPFVFALVTIFTLLWFVFEVVHTRPMVNVSVTIGAFMYTGGLGAFAGLLLTSANGVGLVLGVAIPVIAYDVVGYFVGSQFGKSRLAPQISPNKTIEGLIGGMTGAIIVAVLIVKQIHPWGDLGHALALGVTVAVMAPLGDLAESMLKRDLGIKDFGTILPGHGGVLDRFDALLFCLPAVYFLARALKVG
jgi:phosphatidate cytidylyltransferase